MLRTCSTFLLIRNRIVIMSLSTLPSIGIIVIGNEILNGQVYDENTQYVIRSLPIMGLKLRKISVIPDEVEVIASEVQEFSQNYTFVITSGGIGPTHDDVTFEGVASSFGESVEQHPILTKKLIDFFQISDQNADADARLKLALLPQSAKLTFGFDPVTGNKIPYPVISSHNVYMLPGIPSLFKKGYDIIKKLLFQEGDQLHTNSMYILQEESSIIDHLNEVVKKYERTVLFGSYPVLHNNFYKVKITLESRVKDKIEEASTMLKKLVGEDNVLNNEPMVLANANEQVLRLSNVDGTLGRRVKSVLAILDEAFQKYQPHELMVAFTGGKDCTVLLHLLYAYTRGRGLPMIRALLIRTRPSFPEVEEFVHQALHTYGVVPPRTNFIEYNGAIKDSLWRLKQDHSNIAAVFMGTKSKDPNGNQTVFSHTTDGWPDYCLINPVLEWSYSEIWDFLLTLSVPYCSLYDKGYTSLGGIDNTLPNPELLYTDCDGQRKYHPAYKLLQEDRERCGRELGPSQNSSDA